MADEACGEMQMLIQADIDNELTAAEAVRVWVHLEGCAACAEVRTQLLTLSGRLRREVAYHRAPQALHDAVRTRLNSGAASSVAVVAHEAAVSRPKPPWRFWPVAPFGAGFALAACLALALLPSGQAGVADAVVAEHIRALQPGHLLDVVSTDQHTVKPWFDGRLDFAPPVKDLRADGFPLTGGRLDYLDGRAVAVLVYQHRQHLIELYVWPDSSRLDHGAANGSRSGYNYVRWRLDGMVFWAVSDLNAAELTGFIQRWQAL